MNKESLDRIETAYCGLMREIDELATLAEDLLPPYADRMWEHEWEIKQWKIKCTQCGSQVGSGLMSSLAKAVGFAEVNGWKVVDEIALCAHCVRTRENLDD